MEIVGVLLSLLLLLLLLLIRQMHTCPKVPQTLFAVALVGPVNALR